MVLKVYEVGEGMWYLAESPEQAVELAVGLTGIPLEEMDEVAELSDVDLEHHEYWGDDPYGPRITFAERLQECIRDGEKPGVFACAEY